MGFIEMACPIARAGQDVLERGNVLALRSPDKAVATTFATVPLNALSPCSPSLTFRTLGC